MKIENQVCTLEQAKKLKELGVTAEPLFWYVIDIDPITPLDIIQKWQHSNFDSCEKYPAFTVAELGDMLPTETLTIRRGSENSEYANWEWEDESEGKAWGVFATEAEARADHLIMRLENALITPSEVNQRLNN
jgi:hypothetical protein